MKSILESILRSKLQDMFLGCHESIFGGVTVGENPWMSMDRKHYLFVPGPPRILVFGPGTDALSLVCECFVVK